MASRVISYGARRGAARATLANASSDRAMPAGLAKSPYRRIEPHAGKNRQQEIKGHPAATNRMRSSENVNGTAEECLPSGPESPQGCIGRSATAGCGGGDVQSLRDPRPAPFVAGRRPSRRETPLSSVQRGGNSRRAAARQMRPHQGVFSAAKTEHLYANQRSSWVRGPGEKWLTRMGLPLEATSSICRLKQVHHTECKYNNEACRLSSAIGGMTHHFSEEWPRLGAGPIMIGTR